MLSVDRSSCCLKKDCAPYKGKCDAAQCEKKCRRYACQSATIKRACMAYCDAAIMDKTGCADSQKPDPRAFGKHLQRVCEDEFPVPKDPNERIKDPPNSLECRAACTSYCAPFMCSLDRAVKRKCDEFCSEFKYITAKCLDSKLGPC